MNQVLEIMADTLENKDLSDKQKVDVLTILLNHIKRETSRSEPTDKGFETQGRTCTHGNEYGTTTDPSFRCQLCQF